ncbi:MAG: EAL domain-containing protein [Zoogloea sp.]|jgi:diguanylate cyclase (GGDEF)-like protein|nr:EAL domain-containing protein [Zoogloea sp.]
MSTWDAELERSELSESFPTDFVGLDSGRVNSILRTIEEGILLWNTDGKLMYANPAALAHFNDSEGRSTGCHWAWLAQRCASAEGLPCDGECFPLDRVLAGDADARPVLLQVRCAEDKVRWLRVHTQPLTDTHGAVTGAVCSSVDVTRQVEQENSLKLQAHFDTLTGLPNRVLFSDRLDQALAHARRHRENLAVCMLDLDGFKIVNDSFGHSSGDQLLREVASRLHDSLRGDDTAARLGGDEFALLIGDLKTSGQCEQVVKRVLDAVGAPYFIDGAEVRVTASIGVTLFPGDTMDPDQLLRHADQAMYKAKQAGKNRFSIFDPILESRARANLGLVRKIEQALERHEFVLHYQPKVDCRAGRVVGLEALIRWNHPVLGQRMPGEFLPLIEREDMIVNIGDWVIDEALREQARLRAAGHELTISVNIAARQLVCRQFAERLEAIVGEGCAGSVDPLEIEILESAALEDIGTVSSLIASFQTRGIRFALDDFGTGYSSLMHLKRLAAGVLKIDQAFVRDMLDDPGDLAIVQGVIGLAAAFRRDVVAEGVEDMEHVRMLLSIGCDVMQGHGISRPLPVEAVEAWLRNFKPDPRWRAPLAEAARSGAALVPRTGRLS